ncbi:MAG: hypothetical protein Greene041619_783 [Candidatus Peregrinibacteria bacterium Greene0416_19]|nr:MAG: hypothetical protein Greene041619_783 [Candidatus Peregrinibacteria bacterium Greene0416_19]
MIHMQERDPDRWLPFPPSPGRLLEDVRHRWDPPASRAFLDDVRTVIVEAMGGHAQSPGGRQRLEEAALALVRAGIVMREHYVATHLDIARRLSDLLHVYIHIEADPGQYQAGPGEPGGAPMAAVWALLQDVGKRLADPRGECPGRPVPPMAFDLLRSVETVWEKDDAFRFLRFLGQAISQVSSLMSQRQRHGEIRDADTDTQAAYVLCEACIIGHRYVPEGSDRLAFREALFTLAGCRFTVDPDPDWYTAPRGQTLPIASTLFAEWGTELPAVEERLSTRAGALNAIIVRVSSFLARMGNLLSRRRDR